MVVATFYLIYQFYVVLTSFAYVYDLSLLWNLTLYSLCYEILLYVMKCKKWSCFFNTDEALKHLMDVIFTITVFAFHSKWWFGTNVDRILICINVSQMALVSLSCQNVPAKYNANEGTKENVWKVSLHYLYHIQTTISFFCPLRDRFASPKHFHYPTSPKQKCFFVL